MTQGKNKKVGLRLASILLDHFIMTFGLVLVAFIIFGISILTLNFPSFKVYEAPSEMDSINLIKFIPLLIIALIFSLYLNKDAIGGKSPAKRILGFVILNNKTNKVANPLRLLIRNLPIVIWPIEVIVSIFFHERRIGDYIAGTKVVIDDRSNIAEIKIFQLILSLFFGALFIFSIILLQLVIVYTFNHSATKRFVI